MDTTLELIIISLLLGIMAEIYLLTRPKKHRDVRQISMLVDTSALMDGRIVELAKTGFLLGQVIVPKSVLAEMQLLADGADHAKRERARHGMDVVRQLQEVIGSSFTLLQDGRTATGVDDRLIELAKETDSALLTLDYNLNKVAQVEGIQVLNINELAKSLRMVHLPGDHVTIELTQKGQASDQAVGYLSDGTMVVVEQAKKYIGSRREVEIIRSLQTDAGKMMFAKVVVAEKPKVQPKGTQPKMAQAKVASSRGTTKTTPAKAASSNRPKAAPRRRSQSQREDDLIRLAEGQPESS